MTIETFISNYKNHPILFIGTGVSLRYLKNSYNWNDLLEKVSLDFRGNEEYYYDIKAKCFENGHYKYDKIATLLENDFNTHLEQNREGKFKKINDIFYENMKKGIQLSRFKIYVSELVANSEINEDMKEEIAELKKVRKNISSIITTNYDTFIENIFNFKPLIGNDILLSNPYGSVYKIHGCITQQKQIIITEKDYSDFSNKYELIRAQLLSLFIHNPIIFIGYSISDENIKNILKTIFTYIEPESEDAERIRQNFLLVSRDKNIDSEEILEHDIDMQEFSSTIKINKLKTSNYKPLYTALSNLSLPVSALDIRKVQNVVKEIYSGGSIKVSITDDLEAIDNSEKVLAIGSVNTISYVHQNSSEIMENYFQIIDESNSQLLNIIDKLTIQKQQYFPIFAFSKINFTLDKEEELKVQQKEKLEKNISDINGQKYIKHHTKIDEILNDDDIPRSNKVNALLWGIMKNELSLAEVKVFLENYYDKKNTDYRKLLCAYDYMSSLS